MTDTHKDRYRGQPSRSGSHIDSARSYHDASMSATPEELLAQFACGDDSMFAAFYDQLAGKVLGLVRRVLRDNAQAEEVTQEVFVELWRSASAYYPEKGNVTAWAMSLAHRRAIDRVRSAAATTRREREATFEATSDRAFDQAIESVLASEERVQLVHCLGMLTGSQRETLRLTYYEGWSCGEIAEVTQASPNTVRSRLRSGLRALGYCMQANGHDPQHRARPFG